MARNKGTFTFAANFQVKAAEALDPRVVVENKAELINKETWPYDGETLYLYNGLIVAVSADQALYMLVDKTKALQSDYSGWKQLDADAATVVEIIDNLTSERTDAALSAKQGKVLGDRVSALENKVTAIFTFKGTKATVAELPEDGSQQVGDVWHVTENNGEYVWDSANWELLGLSVDLSNYALKSEVTSAAQGALEDAKEYADGLNSTLQGQLGNKVDKVAGSSLVPDTKIELIDQNAADIAAAEGKISALEALVGDGETSGVAKDVADLKDVVGNEGAGLVKDVADLQTAVAADNVTSIDTTAESGVALASGTVAKSVKVTVNAATLAGAVAPNLSGVSVKVGKAITEGASIAEEDTIADALETLAGAIQTAQAGGITTIGSTDQTITVSGAGNTRDIKVNVANIVKASGSSLINDSGKLDLAWIEVV